MEKSKSPPFQSPEPVGSAKRKRSPSLDATSLPTPPPAKTVRPNPTQLQINYLARQYPEILPLVTAEDSLPTLLSIISDYEGVLQRHESMAGNLGARPLGPILIQRFERLFDGPPKVLKNHGKEGSTIGWLDVVEFARSKPEQFNLERTRDGIRVCQFYTKQCRVEITEDDYVLIASGMPQRLIPPQPIEEDEEKELGTLEILEKNLASVVQAADQVSARARQLNHRLRNRKSAIISRREVVLAPQDEDTRSPRRMAEAMSNGEKRPSVSPTSGFTAVNNDAYSSLSNGSSGRYDAFGDLPRASTSMNGFASRGASAATRAELLSKFHTSSDREVLAMGSLDAGRSGSSYNDPSHRSSLSHKARSKTSSDQLDYGSTLLTSVNAVAIPSTPSSLLPHAKPAPTDRFDDSGPFKADMMLRMEQLSRGDRVKPPCDRCRRLQMDCLKNLTACMGCTKKHAKCSWKDVEQQELKDHPFVPRVVMETSAGGDKSADEGDGVARKKDSIGSNSSAKKDWNKPESREVRDEELLGESSDDEIAANIAPSPDPRAISPGTREDKDTTLVVPTTETTGPTAPLPTANTPSVSSSIDHITATVISTMAEHLPPISPEQPKKATPQSFSSTPDREIIGPSYLTIKDGLLLTNSDETSDVRVHESRRSGTGSGMRWDEVTGRMMLDS